MQNLLSVVLSSDKDKDMIVDNDELDTLIERIEGLGGVQVRVEKFRAAFAGNSIDSLMNVVSNLLSDDVKAEDQIFILEK
jgi:TATA-binding protein-associated factor Taf7